MIELPLGQLGQLLNTLNKDGYVISSVKLSQDDCLDLYFGKLSSPLCICQVKYIHSKTNKEFYYVYLLDICSICVIGKELQVYPDLPITYACKPTFTHVGVTNINPESIHSVGSHYKHYNLYKFIEWTDWTSSIYRDSYKDWILEFMGKRTAFLQLVSEKYNPVYGVPIMSEFKNELVCMVDNLSKDLKTLLNNYPTKD